MGKIIFMLLIAAITWVLFKKNAKPPNRNGSDSNGREESADGGRAPTAKSGEDAQAGNAVAPERMVACSACGVFMPVSDSVRVNALVSCRDPARCAHRPQSATK